MADKPGNELQGNSRDCDYVHELKDDVDNVPLRESIYKEAKLVCAGDNQTATKNLVDGGKLPEMILEEAYKPSNLLERMDNRTDDVKAGLTNAEKDTLLDLESAIVNCDAAELSAKLKEFEANPKEGEKLMGVLVKDLEQAGYQAEWSYSTDETRSGFGLEYRRGPAFGGGYYVTGREDVGHLTITSDSKHDTYNSVSFSTRGEAAAINTPKPSHDDNASSSVASPMEPADALKEAAQHAAHTA